MNIESTIKFKSFNAFKLNNIILDLENYAKENLLSSKKTSFPKKKKKFTVLKSPHVHKKARDQFELETHTKILKIEGTSQNIKEFIKILEMKVLTDITYLISFKKIK